MSIYERGGETYRALQVSGPDDGPAGADYVVRRDSDARFGGYIVDTARDDAGHPAGPGLDADEAPHRFEAYDDAGRYLTITQSLRGAVSVFSRQGTRWIRDASPAGKSLRRADMAGRESSRQDAAASAAGDAYFTAQSSVLRLAEAEGAQIRERPAWPGASNTTRRAEPLAGIRAARILARAAERVAGDYVTHARAGGISWQEIGEALGLAENGQRTGYDLAVRAFEYITDAGHRDRFGTLSFYWTCPACEQGIGDRGPYESHPEDNEHGHAEGCTRLASDIAAWQAERDAEDAE